MQSTLPLEFVILIAKNTFMVINVTIIDSCLTEGVVVFELIVVSFTLQGDICRHTSFERALNKKQFKPCQHSVCWVVLNCGGKT